VGGALLQDDGGAGDEGVEAGLGKFLRGGGAVFGGRDVKFAGGLGLFGEAGEARGDKGGLVGKGFVF